MWNETNPTSFYLGTTWELITAGKYIQSGSTALQTGGSNSITIQKANLPAISVKVNSFSLPTQKHIHKTGIESRDVNGSWSNNKYFFQMYTSKVYGDVTNSPNVQSGGGESTGITSPSTENLGNGQAITIQPNYITLKFWKRTS